MVQYTSIRTRKETCLAIPKHLEMTIVLTVKEMLTLKTPSCLHINQCLTGGVKWNCQCAALGGTWSWLCGRSQDLTLSRYRYIQYLLPSCMGEGVCICGGHPARVKKGKCDPEVTQEEPDEKGVICITWFMFWSPMFCTWQKKVSHCKEICI